MKDVLHVQDSVSARVRAAVLASDQLGAIGIFSARLFDDSGKLLRDEIYRNTVFTAGKNLLLDAALSGNAYTVVGPYLGLISSVGYTGTAAADTMASHAGWNEAGNAHAPTYSGGRPLVGWSASSAGRKALSANLSFTFTGDGTVKGTFIVMGTGAVATVDDINGTALSGGLFDGGDMAVQSGYLLETSYSLGI